MDINIKADELLLEDTYLAIEDMDDLEKVRYKEAVREKAKEAGIKLRVVDDYFKAAEKMIKEDQKRFNRNNNDGIELKRDGNGIPLQTIDNYLSIFREDPFFEGIRFNELANCPEWHEGEYIRRWNDTDDARAKHYVEKIYGINNNKKYEDAIRLLFEERAYHPVKNYIESLEWDGIERIPHILPLWMQCDNDEYTREVSRLIFAGGIHRIYRPGCKFDDVPVLIGTNQGEGKSTFCRWLALDDTFFREVSEIDGQKGMEAIEGGWICELSELLALTRAKEVEAVKSYITRQTDHYRKPYDRHTSEIKRQCIFIGTTNRSQFLTDKSGNRRFYPVVVHSNGYNLLGAEKECRHDIEQAWAEALHLFREGKLEPFAKRELFSLIREKQSSATEEDYREGIIEKWLREKNRTCCIDVWEHTIGNEFVKPTRKESNEIVQILEKLGWERSKKVEWFSSEYGNQRVFIRKKI